MKQKKELTIKQKKNRFRTLQYGLQVGEYISVATPYAVMAGIYHEEWFPTPEVSAKVGLGGALGLALMSLSVALITKKKENDKITNGMVTLLIVWYAVAFIFMLLANINMEIYKLMMWGGLGLAGAVGLDVGSKAAGKTADSLKEAVVQAQAEIDKQKATEEIIKVRIK